MTTTATRRIDRLRASIAPFMAFFDGPFSRLNANPEVANFAVGNPQDMPDARRTSMRCGPTSSRVGATGSPTRSASRRPGSRSPAA